MFPKSVALGLALLSSFAIAPVSLMTALRQDTYMAVAQTTGEPSAFPLPDSVPTDTTIRIDGSSSMIVLNETLKQRFEQQYAGTDVELDSQGTDEALQSLRDGDIDLAAVGRPLTEQEKDEGFVDVPVSREKIAIIVGSNNSFDENLTFEQFARIFRGDITNWSEVGGEPGPIRFVDRDETSDTRLSLSRYEVFQAAPFRSGDTAITVEDDTSAVIEALGSNGISYAIASQVLDQDDVTIISMHQTLPDNPAYPYSQPRGYVYFEEPTAAAAAFLGYATADRGQAAIEDAKEAEASAVAAGEDISQARVIDIPPIGGILYSTSLAYSPDGTLVAAASDNGTVRLFDAEGNPVGEPLSGLPGQLSSLAFSPDGTRLVGATNDGSIQFWNIDGTPIGNPLTGHDSAITSVVFSPDGESIATAGADGTIWRWDLDGNQIGEPFTGHSGAVNGLAFRPSGDAIASAGADGTVRLWNLDGNAIGEPLSGHDGAVNSVAFDASGDTIASGGGDGTIRLWTMDGTAIGNPIEGHEGAVNSVAFIPGSAELASGGADSSLRFWDRDGNSTGVAAGAAPAAIAALALSPDGSSIFTGSTDGTLQARNADGSLIGQPIEGYLSSVTPARGKLPAWIWWLLPLALLALLLWWLSRRSSDTAQEDVSSATSVSVNEDGTPSGGTAVSPHLASAFAAAEAGKTDESLKNFDKAVQEDPGNALAWTARGNLLNQVGRSDEALSSFDNALNIQADSPQALVGKGTALTKLSRSSEAIPMFDRAVDATNRLPAFNIGNLATGGLLLGGTALTAKALSGKGFALLDTQKPQEALNTFDAALSNDARSVDAIAGRNRALGLIGTTKQPSPDVDTGDDTSKAADVSPRLSSALALAEVGKTNEALSTLEQTVTDEPQNALAWTAKGNLLNRLNRPDDALGSFNKALEIQPALPQALVGKGTTLVKTGKSDEAISVFDQAINAADGSPTINVDNLATGGLLLGGAALTAKALSGKGYALLSAQKPSDALGNFDAALRSDSRSVDAIAGRNRALGLLGRTEKASGALADDVTPRLASALALAEVGKTDDALTTLDKTVKEEPENALAWIARGNLLTQVNRPSDALGSFGTALRLQPNASQTLVGNGNALNKLSRPKEAMTAFDQSTNATDILTASNLSGLATGGLLLGGTALTTQALVGKGSALLDTQKPQDALDTFDAALGHDAQNEEAIAGRTRALASLSNAKSPSPNLSTSPETTPVSPDISMSPETPPVSPDDQGTPQPRGIDEGVGGAGLARAGLAGAGAAALAGVGGDRNQATVESTKFDVGQVDLSAEDLADVDQDLADLPDGYGESRIMLLPRDPQWAYTYWDISNDHKEELRQQGGETLALRLYDVTNVDVAHQNPHSMQQYACDELAQSWYVPIPVSDRDYLVEIGYVTGSGAWLMLARSAPISIPPVYPSDWVSDQFLTVDWDDALQGKTLITLVPPDQMPSSDSPIHDHVFGLAQSVESLRVAGSLFGSMNQVPQSAISSYVFPSGAGMWSAAGASGAGLMMSGIGMSGVGFSASAPPIRPRQFWLVADAELIVYGATEPDATVTIGGNPIQLNPDGTFRFQMSFQDGEIDFPIMAVAVDGEQTRSVHMEFERETPSRNTNTKEDAVEEWPE